MSNSLAGSAPRLSREALLQRHVPTVELPADGLVPMRTGSRRAARARRGWLPLPPLPAAALWGCAALVAIGWLVRVASAIRDGRPVSRTKVAYLSLVLGWTWLVLSPPVANRLPLWGISVAVTGRRSAMRKEISESWRMSFSVSLAIARPL